LVFPFTLLEDCWNRSC